VVPLEGKPPVALVLSFVWLPPAAAIPPLDEIPPLADIPPLAVVPRLDELPPLAAPPEDFSVPLEVVPLQANRPAINKPTRMDREVRAASLGIGLSLG
jgi:hypothetical protein